jgi:transglutaminase-like putative cysteine protease
MQKYLPWLFNILLGFLAIMNVQIANAATPVVHVAPKPAWISPCKPYNQRPSTRNIENGAYNELVEEQVNVETHATYNHFITQIVSESGVQDNSEISVSFNPSYERLDFHSIVVWRDNKPQNRLNINAFKILADESEFDRFIYNGTYAAKYILADIRKGDKIEYSYTITGSNPIFNNKFCRSIYFQGSSIFEHQYTTLLVSANRKLNFKSFNNIPKAAISNVNGGMKRYEWESFQVPPVRSSNSRQPDWYNEFQRVQVSDYSNWSEVVDWALKINPLTTNFTGELAGAIAKLKSQSGTDKEKYFRNAVELVQDEVRYMGIETGEYSHRANDPEKVFKQRYGDCKDKSLLLASILKAGGIDAAMALVSTSLEDKIDDFLPSSALFNHAVVVATVNGKQVWVDATIAYQRGTGTDIYFPAYRRALILKAGTNALAVIPLCRAGKIICTENYIVTNEKDSVALQVKTKYTLNQADDIRRRLASSSATETEKSYLDYYSKIYPSVEAKDTIAIIDNEAKNELTTIENYRIGHYMKLDSAAGNYTGSFYANMINEQLPKINGQTKTPVSVNYPFDMDYTVNLIFPLPWTIEEKQSSVVRDNYEFYFNRLVKGDTLALHYRFAYVNDYIPTNKVSEFMQDVKDISDNKLGFNFFYTPAAKNTPNTSGVNLIMVIFAAVATFLYIYIGVKLYQKETSSSRLAGYSYGRPLGGWLLLIIFGLLVTMIKIPMALINDYFFKLSAWNNYHTGTKGILFKALLMFETAGNVLTMCYAVFCLVLIFGKRDILPKYISGFYLYCMAFIVVDTVFAAYFSNITNAIWYNILRAVLVASIWIPYFRLSTRVKETFITPYPNYNIIYQEPEADDFQPIPHET